MPISSAPHYEFHFQFIRLILLFSLTRLRWLSWRCRMLTWRRFTYSEKNGERTGHMLLTSFVFSWSRSETLIYVTIYSTRWAIQGRSMGWLANFRIHIFSSEVDAKLRIANTRYVLSPSIFWGSRFFSRRLRRGLRAINLGPQKIEGHSRYRI